MSDQEFMSIPEAGIWASHYLGKNVTPSNISYLVQYGRVKKNGENGTTRIAKNDLLAYYEAYKNSRENQWKAHLGDDLNWALSFDQYKESETTKHVHRLHPYKGKFIPQLVEYFLDDHIDKFKLQPYFKEGDIVLDPFSGSGTTLVQANELGINAIGIDISEFNALISNCKIAHYDLSDVAKETHRITSALKSYTSRTNTLVFEKELLTLLNEFNEQHFPVPEYKYRLRQGEIDEQTYAKEKEIEFIDIYNSLIEKHQIKLRQDKNKTFIDRWFLQQVRDEIDFAYNEVKKINNSDTKRIVSLILCRTIRSCRSTTHADLGTLIAPIMSTYYCTKHGKMCKPIFSINKWWRIYSNDTLLRLAQFSKLRTASLQECLIGDSRTINIFEALYNHNETLANLASRKKINGIFSSPPYVGLIDYHEQHAYAYDLLSYERRDAAEIGPLFKGQGREAKQSYVEGISQVLINCKQYMTEDYNVLLVANDKYGLYPTIANNAAMRIVNQYKRPVLNRTEKDKGAYSETIFHLKSV